MNPSNGHAILGNPAVMEALYVEADWTLQDIAWASGCSYRQASKALRETGVTDRHAGRKARQ